MNKYIRIIKDISKMINNIEKNLSKIDYDFNEEQYKNKNSISTILNAIDVLKKCYDVNVEIDDEYYSTMQYYSPDGIFILINNHGILLKIQEAEDILLCGPSIANDFILDVLKDDVKFKRKLKLQKINVFKISYNSN